MSAMPIKKVLDPLKQLLGGCEETEEEAGEGAIRPSVRNIEDALLRLKDKERLVLALRYYEKLTERDVAAALRMKTSEVRRIQREAIDVVVKYLACVSRGQRARG